MIELKTNNTSVTVFTPTGETLKGSYDKGYEQGYEDGANSIDISEETRKAFNEGLEEGKPLGKLELLQDSEYMNAKVSGTAIAVNDVSPIEHSVGCYLTSDTITDFSGIEVSRYGKNLFDKSIPYEDYTPHGGGYSLLSIYVGSGSSVTVSLKQKHDIGLGGYFYCIAYKSGVAGASQEWLYHNSNTSLCVKSVTMISEDSHISLIMTSDAYNSFKDEVMVEIGTTATSYEPYIEPTVHTANADGIVEGIRSLYPSMTLLTNNNGAAINCNYLRDIDTYIDNVITNVALTGGEN